MTKTAEKPQAKTETKPECAKSEDGKHEWSIASTFPFCIWCGKMKNE